MEVSSLRRPIFIFVLINVALLIFGAWLQFFKSWNLGDLLYFKAYLILPITITAIFVYKLKDLKPADLISYIFMVIGSTLVAISSLIAVVYDSGIKEIAKF